MMDRFRGFLLHTGAISSFVCIAAKILDQYNPYMDLTGHIWSIQLALYLAAILSALIKKAR